MKLNRKGVIVGLVGLGLAGALVGGIGTAAAATGTAVTTPSVAAAPSTVGAGMAVGSYWMANGRNSGAEAAASYLGLDQSGLQAKLAAGSSLADIAHAQGKSVAGLEEAMAAAVKVNLDATTTLTADQRKATLTLVRSHLDTMVNTRPGDGSMGPRMGR